MKIKISAGEKLAAALAEVQGRATERTLNAAEIQRAAERAEMKLLQIDGLKKKDLPGVQLLIGCSESFPKAYKWAPMATYARLERTASGWNLVELFRKSARYYADSVGFEFSEDQKKKIAAAAVLVLKPFR
jgi:hypothetical protein